jgi:hypothetical protein
LERLPADSRLHRIHGVRWRGGQFNASVRRSRFAPIADEDGHRIPVLYAGATFDVAVYESLFHAVGPGPDSRTWPASRIEIVAHSVLKTERDLQLAPLFRRNLIAWNITDKELVQAPARYYDRTATWGEAVHRSISDADGLVWISSREGGERCCVFFGDRVAEHDFVVVTRRATADETFLADVRRSARRGDITITI